MTLYIGHQTDDRYNMWSDFYYTTRDAGESNGREGEAGEIFRRSQARRRNFAEIAVFSAQWASRQSAEAAVVWTWRCSSLSQKPAENIGVADAYFDFWRPHPLGSGGRAQIWAGGFDFGRVVRRIQGGGGITRYCPVYDLMELTAPRRV